MRHRRRLYLIVSVLVLFLVVQSFFSAGIIGALTSLGPHQHRYAGGQRILRPGEYIDHVRREQIRDGTVDASNDLYDEESFGTKHDVRYVGTISA